MEISYAQSTNDCVCRRIILIFSKISRHPPHAKQTKRFITLRAAFRLSRITNNKSSTSIESMRVYTYERVYDCFDLNHLRSLSSSSGWLTGFNGQFFDVPDADVDADDDDPMRRACDAMCVNLNGYDVYTHICVECVQRYAGVDRLGAATTRNVCRFVCSSRSVGKSVQMCILHMCACVFYSMHD